MKSKELKQLRKSTMDELISQLAKKRQELEKAKIETLIGKQKNLKYVSSLRRHVAQMATVIREMEIRSKSKEEE